MMVFSTLVFLSTKLVIFLYFLSLIILGFPLIISYASKLPGNETDFISLFEFKKMIKDDPFNVMVSWNETIHFCEWPGVLCGRRHHRVTSINLNSLKLIGTVTSHIGNLSFLRDLDLRNNSFSGNIPQDIGRLHKLQNLYLNNNSFSGIIPSNISACKKLQIIHFSHNNLVGNIPSELGTLTNLRALICAHNNLTGKIPHSLGNLSSLYNFYSTFNNLLGEIPDSLCSLPKLNYLVLGGNNLVGTIPSSLFNNSSIRVIDVSLNYMEGNLPPNLFITLPHLSYFAIVLNNFTGSIPITLSNATNLQFFSIGWNKLTGRVPDDLRKLQNILRFTLEMNHLGHGEVDDLDFLSSLINATSLEKLVLNSNNFGGLLPESIANLSRNLIGLELYNNQVFGNIPRGISNLVGLQGLNLASNKLSGKIPPEIGFLRNLQALYLNDNNLSGKIPSSFGNLTRLTILSLAENYLQDVIPPSLGKCQNLEFLALANNNLSGYIPKQLLQLSSLSIALDLSYNNLVGSIPEDVGYLVNLGYLDLSYNSLSDHVPSELGSCLYLEMLNLTNNNLEGPIPSTFVNLRGLQYLQLSHNNLTGKIPAFLKDFKFLVNLNLSYNDFEGAVPTMGIFNNTSSFSVVGNRKLCGGITELSLHECNTTKPSKKKKTKTHLKVLIPLILGITLVVFILCLRWLRGQRKEPFPYMLENSTLRVSYHSLLKSTNGFSEENLLGVGGFGSVYKGSFDQDGTAFAVKVLDLLRHGASHSFEAECEVLKNTRHRNLVKVLTACSGFDLQGNDFKALVYEYMDNGNLENWLHFISKENSGIEENRRLSFVQRINILIDMACALDYLHNDCEPAIIHCDLKPSNVLLDKNMTAHVSDFGLARFVQQRPIQSSSENNSSIGVEGTIGYAPPEYGMGSKPSKAGDVYSFGILILEILTGRRPTDELFQDGLNLHGYAKAALADRGVEIADPKILQERDEQVQMRKKGKWCEENDKFDVCLVYMIKVGVACSVEFPADRMKIGDVVGELNKARKSFLM